jgi:phosphoribosylaminoimidazolecarboxamide formyltransferase/IMP cyclohydrolase
VHAGILADTRKPDHSRSSRTSGVAPFDLVVSNLYPFTETVASGAGPDECVEQIDIGGPSMVRAAAKNHPSVAIVTSPAQYGDAGGAGRGRLHLASAAARWRRRSRTPRPTTWRSPPGWAASCTDTSGGDGFPAWIGGSYTKLTTLRYGENPHQPAALYAAANGAPGLGQARQLHGKEMSYNNYVDADAAVRAAYDFADAGRGDHQARQPVRHRRPGATTSPRRRKAGTPATR